MRFSPQLPVLVVIGPSGAGKSSVVRRLHDEGLVYVNATWTTRPPRPGEAEEGIEHYFASDEEFAAQDNAKFFLETAQMFGLPYRYGLPPLRATQPGKPSLVMLRASLLPMFDAHYDNYVTYHIEDDMERIQQRLTDRQQHGEAMGSRLDDYQKEVSAGRKLAKRVFVNKNIDTLAEQIKQALREDFS